ncbi:MAG: helix-turn-helix transcriptional regulator [Acidimicrobiales bacterium]
MERLERLVNLVAALIDAETPLSREQLQARIGGYTDDAASARRNFERDKELLRQMGLPLVTEPLDPRRPDDQLGYRIPRERYELADPDLAEDELAALRLAASAVRVEGAWGHSATERALQKLAGGGAGADVGEMASLPAGDAVAVAFGAVAERRRLEFRYRGSQRRVDPWRLSYRGGHWYLAGWDHGRGQERLYRLDRVEGEVSAEDTPGAYARPDAGKVGPPPPWRIGDDEEVVADLAVDADQARWAVGAMGEAAVTERSGDGSVRLAVPVTNRAAFRSFVLGFLDHAEVLGPPELRAEMVAWLTAVAGL